jgi:hypothetical protein
MSRRMTVEYGVEVRHSPTGGWHYRYGWFSEEEGGEAHMRETLRLVRADGSYSGTRLVRRHISTDVLDESTILYANDCCPCGYSPAPHCESGHLPAGIECSKCGRPA